MKWTIAVLAVLITAQISLADPTQGPKPNVPAPIPTPGTVTQGPKPNEPCRACVAQVARIINERMTLRGSGIHVVGGVMN